MLTRTYQAFFEKYPVYARKLKSEIEVFPISSSLSNTGAKAHALWDTGAALSVISPDLQQRLGLQAIARKTVFGINNRQEVDIVLISVRLPNDSLISNVYACVCNIPAGIDVLIRMNIIRHGDLGLFNSGGQTLFSFVMQSLPNPVNLANIADNLNEHTNMSHAGEA
jgi:hypothetical protein